MELIASLLILLFFYTAVSKLLEYQTFKLQLGKSPFITQFSSLIAWMIPMGEIFIGAALIFKRTRLLGLYGSLFLMTMFTAYIYAMLNYSYDLPCSCGGIISKMTWTQHLWFNIGFVILCIVGILLQTKLNAKGYKKLEIKHDELPSVVYTAFS